MDRGRLVFTRKAGQSFSIGEGVTVTVRSVKGRSVKIVVEAPKSVAVLRSEVERRAA